MFASNTRTGGGSVSRRRGLALAMAVVAMWAVQAAAQFSSPATSTVDRVFLCPGRTGLWTAVTLAADGEPARLRPGYTVESKPWHWIDDTPGRAVSLVVMDELLYAAFDDGPITRFDQTSRQDVFSLPWLPKDYRVVQLIGDAGRHRVLALAERAPVTTTSQPGAASKPADASKAKGGSSTMSPNVSRATLFEYQQGQWNRIVDLPATIHDVRSARVVVLDRRIVLLTLTSSQMLTCWTYAGNQWLPAMDVKLPLPIDRFWLGASSSGTDLLIVTGLKKDGLIEFDLYTLNRSGSLKTVGPIKVADAPEIPEASCDVAIAADRILLGWVEKDYSLRLVTLDQAGQSSGGVVKLPIGPRASNQQNPVISMLMFGAVLLVYFFTRTLRPIGAVSLPRDVVVAEYSRRLFASLIDMIPATVIMAIVWPAEVLSLADIQDVLEVMNRTDTPEYQHRMMLWMIFCGLYSVTCLIPELIWSTSMGKAIFGLKVVSLKSPESRPMWLQSVVRGVVLAFEVYQLLILVVVFFTIFRQRIGDLVAGTVVVQKRPVSGDAERHE